MIISFKSVEIENFKGIEQLKVEFGDLTKISGKNGEGKSSIGDAITYCLFGTDNFGSPLDPTPIKENFDADIYVNLVLTVNEQEIRLARGIQNKNYFYIGDTPSTATEFKDYVESLFNKELFLSLFNPNFFSSQHWKKQREQLLQYVNEPLKKDVFEKMAKIVAERLEDPMKKHSLEDLEKIHKDRFKKRDTEWHRASERVLTLQEQMEKATGDTDIRPLQKEYLELQEKFREAKAHNDKVQAEKHKLSELMMKGQMIREQIDKKKTMIEHLAGAKVEDTCETCGQALTEEHKEHAVSKWQEHLLSLKQEGKDLVLEFKHTKEMAEETVPGELIDVEAMMERMAELKAMANDMNRLRGLQDEIDESKEKLNVIHNERNESQGILDAIKQFREEQALLMVEQVNSLFEVLSVKLFEKQKNGEYKHTFEIEMDGKPYNKLSTAEKIKAGLELIQVMQDLSDTIVPTFVDNAESVLNFKGPTGQLITATVKNTKLKVEA